MNQETSTYIETGDYPIVDEWVNNWWPDNAKKAIMTYIPDFQHRIKFRTCVKFPTISKSLEDSFQLVINYNCDNDCFIVWNAAIQNHIHWMNSKKKLHLDIGCSGERLMHRPIDANTITHFFREFGRGGSKYVEMISIVGKDALADFCKDYSKMIIPDPNSIPKGRICLYAVAGGEIQYILSRREA